MLFPKVMVLNKPCLYFTYCNFLLSICSLFTRDVVKIVLNLMKVISSLSFIALMDFSWDNLI